MIFTKQHEQRIADLKELGTLYKKDIDDDLIEHGLVEMVPERHSVKLVNNINPKPMGRGASYKKIKYEFNGEKLSPHEIASRVGMKSATLYSRLYAGVPIEIAAKKDPRSKAPKRYEDNKTLKQIAEEYGINKHTLRKRLQRGIPVESAVKHILPKEYVKQSTNSKRSQRSDYVKEGYEYKRKKGIEHVVLTEVERNHHDKIVYVTIKNKSRIEKRILFATLKKNFERCV